MLVMWREGCMLWRQRGDKAVTEIERCQIQRKNHTMEEKERKIKKPRRYNKLPVVICEWHHHVLPHIHRAVGSRHLPDNGLKLLHLDSHPDLTFPVNLIAENCFDRDNLYDNIEIADWILPLVYENHLSEVVWMKPPWAKQIQDGTWCVKVGESKDNKFLRISCKEDYFLEELLYEKEEKLEKSKDLKLIIETLKSSKTKDDYQPSSLFESKDSANVSSNCELANSIAKTESFEQIHFVQDEKLILDIDLDFFSTYNPFILSNNKVHFDLLADIYKFEAPKTNCNHHIEESLARREKQLVTLQKTIKYFHQNFLKSTEHKTGYLNLISDDSQTINASEINNQYLNLLIEMQKQENLEGREIDLELVHFAGTSSELPHHRSTTEEIDCLLSDVQNLLSKRQRPSFITISRSAKDEYTPPDQVEFIQEKVIEMLELLYSDINVIKDYELEIDSNSLT